MANVDYDTSYAEVTLRFQIDFYNAKLNEYASIDYGQLSEQELHKIGGEAASLYKILLDFNEEGYTDQVDAINAQTNALTLLPHFLTTALAHLGRPAEKHAFSLCPEVVEIEGLKDAQFTDGPSFELDAYLNQLDDRSDTSVTIAHCFENPEQMRHWQAKTHILMSEMVAFLMWVVERLQQKPGAVPVLLLRDTLLVYFGLCWLRQHGLAIPSPRPMLLSRKFVALWAEPQNSYVKLTGNIHGILHQVGMCDLPTFRQLFVNRALSFFSEEHPFSKGCCAYLDRLSLEGSPLVIESGLYGTFPLWLLSLTNNVGDFVLYATAPWLSTTYRDITFRENYTYLRDVETIVIHNSLFQLSTVCSGKVIVTETRNALAQSLAHYELHLFRQLVKQQIKELA